MSYPPRAAVEVHYVLDIRVQEVVVAATDMKNSVENRVVRDVAHYVVHEKLLPVILVKGMQLLKLTGEQLEAAE